MLHGAAMMDLGVTMSFQIQVTIHQMEVGQQVHDIGMVLVPRFLLENSGGGRDKPKPSAMEMQLWKAGLMMHLVVPMMPLPPMVCSRNISITTVYLTMSAPWSIYQGELLTLFVMNQILTGHRLKMHGLA